MAFDAGLPSEPKPALDFKAFLKFDPATFEFKPVPPPPQSFNPHRPQPPLGFDLALLKIARERLARGWTQRQMYSYEKGGVCAVGALLCAIQGHNEPTPPTIGQDIVVERLARHINGMSASALMSENDERMTNKEYMLALFDRAIRRLEEKVFGQTTQTSRVPYVDIARAHYRPVARDNYRLEWDMP